MCVLSNLRCEIKDYSLSEEDIFELVDLDLCVFFGFVNYLCCAEMVPKLFFPVCSFLVMTLRNKLCVAMFVCEQVFLILPLT